MKFAADVNIAQKVIKLLVQNGHDVLDIKKQNRKAPDIGIIKLAFKEKRIILTHDKDFQVLAQFPKYQVGTIVTRLKKQTPLHHWEKLQNLVKDKSEEELNNSLTILTEETAETYPFDTQTN